MARVLIVDDDADIREGVHDVLAACGHSVLEASNGTVGLQQLTRNNVDLVLMDILMPDKEGIETIQEIRRMQPDKKILAMSGCEARHDYLDFAKYLGADAVLTKPFQPAELLEAIGSVLSVQPRNTDERERLAMPASGSHHASPAR
jgi:DNA-binding response OmpR family regulator